MPNGSAADQLSLANRAADGGQIGAEVGTANSLIIKACVGAIAARPVIAGQVAGAAVAPAGLNLHEIEAVGGQKRRRIVRRVAGSPDVRVEPIRHIDTDIRRPVVGVDNGMIGVGRIFAHEKLIIADDCAKRAKIGIDVGRTAADRLVPDAALRERPEIRIACGLCVARCGTRQCERGEANGEKSGRFHKISSCRSSVNCLGPDGMNVCSCAMVLQVHVSSVLTVNGKT